MNDALKNQALNLSLEWGENWQSPVGPRLLKLHPELSELQLAELEKLCRDIQKFAFDLYEKLYGQDFSRDNANNHLLAQFAFLDDENLVRLYNQGMYYAWRALTSYVRG